ncbi:MAG: tetratricopeptide repeat protein [Candidatus Nitrotoga sp.]|nr:tetratricopeptide repeat protein [Candidatus Nitrotoga sp.]
MNNANLSPFRQIVMALWACGVLAVLSCVHPAHGASTLPSKGIVAYRQGDFATAQRLLLPAATNGDAQAELLLGNIASQREGTVQDMSEEARWYRMAADKGLATAQAKLAACYVTGSGVPQSDVEAVKWYLLAAAQGELQAAASLGYYYQLGNDIPHDYTKAAHWYRVAAEHGDMLSQDILGDFYTSGIGVPQSAQDATAWYRRAGEQGDPNGQYQLAVAYYEGLGVKRDLVTAYFWVTLALKKLSEKGEKDAAIRLIAAIAEDMTRDRIDEATRRATAWHPVAGTAQDYLSPDGTLRAVVLVSEPNGESQINILERKDILLTHSYASTDGQHGFVVQHAEWTVNSRFFVFSLSSSGGHQPWRFTVFVYSRRTNTLAALEKYSGPITEPDFHLIAPDTIEVMLKQKNADPKRVQVKLGKLFTSKP